MQQPVTPGEAAGLSPREGIVAELARNSAHRQEYVLKDVVGKGVAFHHAGLTADERELVERAYWSGDCSSLLDDFISACAGNTRFNTC